MPCCGKQPIWASPRWNSVTTPGTASGPEFFPVGRNLACPRSPSCTTSAPFRWKFSAPTPTPTSFPIPDPRPADWPNATPSKPSRLPPPLAPRWWFCISAPPARGGERNSSSPWLSKAGSAPSRMCRERSPPSGRWNALSRRPGPGWKKFFSASGRKHRPWASGSAWNAGKACGKFLRTISGIASCNACRLPPSATGTISATPPPRTGWG